ncbi:hypothetical protein G5C51_01030 [Streptomyces sp. A7024]|uniref:Uncharacterized protein n=1 Tax=Streptomyces coryli TaxID=1128680 RepID=A0A6G4TSQ4_9ACTN|nr:hypothetical protein [Streptomyces coryli]
MRLLDILLGRSRPAAPDLDRLFALPAAAIAMEATAGFRPTGLGSVCFAPVEGAAFEEAELEIRALLAGDAARLGGQVEVSRDAYGYAWLLSRRSPADLPGLVGDLHTVNSVLEAAGFGPQLLCSLVGFSDHRDRRLALIYLYKRGAFYPFAPLPGERRDNTLELQVKAAVAEDLPIEQELTRWFPVWGAPGL